MLKGPRGVIVFVLGAVAIIAAVIWFGFQDQKGDARTARSFLTLAAEGQIVEARALLHPGTAAVFSAEAMRTIFDPLEPFSEIDFNAVAWSISNGVRQARLEGRGITAAGCSSGLTFELLDGQITHFGITPLCPRAGQSI